MRRNKHKIFIFVLLAVIFQGFCCSFDVVGRQLPKNLKNSKDYESIVKYYRYLNPDSALFYVKAGLKIAKEQEDEKGKAALLNQYGMIEDNFARYADSKAKYLEAAEIYRRIGDSNALATILIRLSVVERRKGNYDKAFAYAFDALKISERNKNALGILEARNVLAETFYDLSDYENALKNLKIGEQINAKVPLTNLTLNMYDDFGAVYIKLKDYGKAIQYVEKGLAKSNKVEYNGLRISLFKTLGRAYQLKGDNKEAEKTLKKALTFSREIKNILREQTILIEIANLFEKKQPDTALKYLNQALDIVAKYKIYRQEILVLNKISSIYKLKGNLHEALVAKEKSSDIAEQVFYKDMMKQVFSLEAAYELEKSKVKLSEMATKSREQQEVKNIILSVAVGSVLLLVITFIYFLKSRKLNKLLTRANAGLEESNDVKNKLLSIIAHDIRSPLVSTISILKLIGDKELDEETQGQMVNKLVSHCDSGLEILDKLLKWGQMQIKGVRLSISDFSPLPNIKRNLALLQEAARQKNITIKVAVAENILLRADTDHFDFITRNLLANAIKFTNINGEIEIKAELVEKNKIKFEVKDNGVGISKSRIEKLFELSAMGTKGTSAEEGTSLGLIICREFILANQGELHVESELGKGTTFSFTLNGFAP